MITEPLSSSNNEKNSSHAAMGDVQQNSRKQHQMNRKRSKKKADPVAPEPTRITPAIGILETPDSREIRVPVTTTFVKVTGDRQEELMTMAEALTCLEDKKEKEEYVRRRLFPDLAQFIVLENGYRRDDIGAGFLKSISEEDKKMQKRSIKSLAASLVLNFEYWAAAFESITVRPGAIISDSDGGWHEGPKHGVRADTLRDVLASTVLKLNVSKGS